LSAQKPGLSIGLAVVLLPRVSCNLKRHLTALDRFGLSELGAWLSLNWLSALRTVVADY
jgi:hypothetical protein